MSNSKGGKFHPSNISGEQKFLRKLDADRQKSEKRFQLKPLDTTKQNWSSGGK